MADVVLEDDGMCFGCGKKNSIGLKMEFDHPEQGVLLSTVRFEKHHQGYKDIVHGGIVGLALDEVMVNLLLREKIPAVSAELNVRLKKPTKVGQRVRLKAHIDRDTPRAVYTSAVATDGESGEILAAATATCLRIKNHNIPGLGKS